MYTIVIVKEIIPTYKINGITPVDYYVMNDQWQFQLTSFMFLAIFAVLIYARLKYPSVGKKVLARRFK